MIAYKEFSKLNIRKFYPKDADLCLIDNGFECALGSAGCDGFAFTYFAWPENDPQKTGEISLDFRDEYAECPPRIAQQILDAVKLPIHSKMTKQDVVRILGEPKQHSILNDDIAVYEYRVQGELESIYKVLCYFSATLGFTGIQIVREDLLES